MPEADPIHTILFQQGDAPAPTPVRLGDRPVPVLPLAGPNVDPGYSLSYLNETPSRTRNSEI